MYVIKVKNKDLFISIVKNSYPAYVYLKEADLKDIRTYKTKANASNSLNYTLNEINRNTEIKNKLGVYYDKKELEIVEVELKMK